MAKSSNRSTTVSVALCTFNSSAFIQPQLWSILDQDEVPGEIIVSDDGSTDNTLAIVAEVRRTHARGGLIRVLEPYRVGGVARNFARAVAACTGDAIALADHDDVWLPHKLTALLGARRDATLVFSDAFIIDGEGVRTGETLFDAYGVGPQELDEIDAGKAFTTLQRRNIVTGATVLVDRAFAQRALPAGTSWVHDEWLAFLAAATGTVGVVREPLMEYRVHDGNQIGVPGSSAVGNFIHGLRAGSARYKMHRDRTLALWRALAAMDAPGDVQQSVRARLEFDTARLAYPAFPLARIGRIRQQALLGAYSRFCSNERQEQWRDALQRP